MEKKKKGRPRKDARLLPMALSMQVSLAGAPPGRAGPPHPPESSSPPGQLPRAHSGLPLCDVQLPCGPQGGEAGAAGPASLGDSPAPGAALQRWHALRDNSALAVPRCPDRREGHCVCVRPSACAEAADAGPPESLHPPGELALGREPERPQTRAASTRPPTFGGAVADPSSHPVLRSSWPLWGPRASPVACPPRPAAPLGAQLLKTHPRGPFSQKPPRSGLWALGSVPGGLTHLWVCTCRTPGIGGREGL